MIKMSNLPYFRFAKISTELVRVLIMGHTSLMNCCTPCSYAPSVSKKEHRSEERGGNRREERERGSKEHEEEEKRRNRDDVRGQNKETQKRL